MEVEERENTAISGSDLEYYILFDKSKEDFLKKIESFYNNNKFKKYISDKLHNNIKRYGRISYSTQNNM